ncbi:unnamed protein product [Trichogramma brassicae]|uniref:Uncharacterized protein n=1 Tax=Trichogramma brassicae TaxID=86971 RepID=A0A6H5J2N4_9HYME|nr:unnamed protein product [Trichogramma brassicae]
MRDLEQQRQERFLRDLEQQRHAQLPPAATVCQQQAAPQQQQQPVGEDWDASDNPTYVPLAGPSNRSKAERRRARRERRRLYGRGQPQRPRSPEPGRPIPGQEQLPNDMLWLEEYIKTRGI